MHLLLRGEREGARERERRRGRKKDRGRGPDKDYRTQGF